MAISERDMEHVFERLRSGVVPERGLEMFAVGIEKKRAEIQRLLKLAEEGEGVFKFLRGGLRVWQDLYGTPGPPGGSGTRFRDKLRGGLGQRSALRSV